MTTSILETSLISPPPISHEEDEELRIPLTFFDIFWIHFPHPIRQILFYKQPCSKPFFLNTIVPKLKESLSLTLKHYIPVAGKLLYPLNARDDPRAPKPFIRCKNGDSIPFTIAESGEDLDELMRNHPRDADRFYAFIPQMPPFGEEGQPPSYMTIPLMAIQVTLFPGRGLCMGISYNHSLGDANSIARFIKSWAAMSKGEAYGPPLVDKSLVKDPLGIDDIYWGDLKNLVPVSTQFAFPLPTNRLRATFILNKSHMEKLKRHVLAKKPGLTHVSSFVVAASYAWSCFVKSGAASDKDADEMFRFAVDVRSRVDPLISENYFGNCLAVCRAVVKHRDLIGEQGFVLAAEYIKNRINAKGRVLKGIENSVANLPKFMGMSILGVSGSPKFDLYEVDFGFGRAVKHEVLSIDGEMYSMSLCKSRDFEGGMEIGFSLPQERMKSFEAIFEDELNKIMNYA